MTKKMLGQPYDDSVLKLDIKSLGLDDPFDGHIGVEDQHQPTPEQRRRRRRLSAVGHHLQRHFVRVHARRVHQPHHHHLFYLNKKKNDDDDNMIISLF